MEMGTEVASAFVAPFRRLLNRREASETGVKYITYSTRTPCPTPLLLLCFLLAVVFSSPTALAKSYEGNTADGNWRITCYTCMNVSNNEECNRYAIDRPCPEGRDFCLTLHVMEGTDADRSVLVNKRCAPLEDCVGDSTGCTTAYGQTQCVSCCNQPYCNDYVPSNDTDAVFQRSAACGTLVSRQLTNWRSHAAVLCATLLAFIGRHR